MAQLKDILAVMNATGASSDEANAALVTSNGDVEIAKRILQPSRMQDDGVDDGDGCTDNTSKSAEREEA